MTIRGNHAIRFRPFAIASALALVTGSASAADVSNGRAAPVFSWTGCYVGGHAGWVQNDSRITTHPIGDVAGLIGPAGVLASTYTYRPTGSEASAGAHYGCNVQFGHWVLGLDSSWSWSGLDAAINADIPLGVFQPHQENTTQQLDWYNTTRIRAGVALDRLMLFAAGGLAAGRVSSEFEWRAVAPPPIGTFVSSGSQARTRYGWTIGGGAEYALFDNWFLRAEYLYVDLGKFDYDAAAPGGPPDWRTDIDTRFHTVRLGLSYRFTGARSLLEWGQGGFR
jgi:outer membrane immunogenic protein